MRDANQIFILAGKVALAIDLLEELSLGLIEVMPDCEKFTSGTLNKIDELCADLKGE